MTWLDRWSRRGLGREGAERPDLDERIEHLAVAEAQVDPGAEVGQRAEWATLVAGRDDRLEQRAFHRGRPERGDQHRRSRGNLLREARFPSHRLKADIRRHDWNVRFVPIADIARAPFSYGLLATAVSM